MLDHSRVLLSDTSLRPFVTVLNCSSLEVAWIRVKDSQKTLHPFLAVFMIFCLDQVCVKETLKVPSYKHLNNYSPQPYHNPILHNNN